VLVVVQGVGREDVLEVAAADDQEPVEALASDAADPALGVCPRLWRPHRRLDYTDAFGAEDLVELAGELTVAVTDEVARAGSLVVELHQQVARLLAHPRPIRVGRDPANAHPPSRQLDEAQDVEAPEEERVDREEVALKD